MLGPLGVVVPSGGGLARQGGECVVRPAEFKVGGHCGTQLEGSSRCLVLGPGLIGEDWAVAKDLGSLILESEGH